MPITRLRNYYDPTERDAYREWKKNRIWCCAIPLDQYSDRLADWRKQRYADQPDPATCRRMATVKINNKPYCRPHAGLIALRKWLDGELTEAQPEAANPPPARSPSVKAKTRTKAKGR